MLFLASKVAIWSPRQSVSFYNVKKNTPFVSCQLSLYWKPSSAQLFLNERLHGG
jgi:hypothetical protein